MSHMHAIKTDTMWFGNVSHACYQKWHHVVWSCLTCMISKVTMRFAHVSHAYHQKWYNVVWWCLTCMPPKLIQCDLVMSHMHATKINICSWVLNWHTWFGAVLAQISIFNTHLCSTWHKNTYRIYSSARQSCSLNFVLKYLSVPQICVQSTKMDCSEPNHAEPNQGLHCPIIWDLCSSEILRSTEW